MGKKLEGMDKMNKRCIRTSGIALSGRSGGADEERYGWKKGWQASTEACSLTNVRKGA